MQQRNINFDFNREIISYGGEPPYQAHSETSRAAAHSMIETAPTIESLVLAFIQKRGILGATDLEIADSLNMPINTIVPRRRCLDQKCKIHKHVKRQNRTGRNAVVWIDSRIYKELNAKI